MFPWLFLGSVLAGVWCVVLPGDTHAGPPGDGASSTSISCWDLLERHHPGLAAEVKNRRSTELVRLLAYKHRQSDPKTVHEYCSSHSFGEFFGFAASVAALLDTPSHGMFYPAASVDVVYVGADKYRTLDDLPGSFYREQLIGSVLAARQKHKLNSGAIVRRLAKGFGAADWRGSLAELNAHVHALEAFSMAYRKGDLGVRGQDDVIYTNVGTEVLYDLIYIAFYVQYAYRSKGTFYRALRKSASSLDTLRVLWNRAVETYLRTPQELRSADGPALHEVLRTATPALRKLYLDAKQPLPRLDIPEP